MAVGSSFPACALFSGEECQQAKPVFSSPGAGRDPRWGHESGSSCWKQGWAAALMSHYCRETACLWGHGTSPSTRFYLASQCPLIIIVTQAQPAPGSCDLQHVGPLLGWAEPALLQSYLMTLLCPGSGWQLPLPPSLSLIPSFPSHPPSLPPFLYSFLNKTSLCLIFWIANTFSRLQKL